MPTPTDGALFPVVAVAARHNSALGRNTMNQSQRKGAMNLLLVILLMTPVVGLTAESEERDGYLCIPSYSTGFIYRKSGKWVPTNFDISGDKYLLTKKETGWVWNKVGQKWFTAVNCEDRGKGYLKCDGLLNPTHMTEIRMNRITLRYQAIHPYGYVNADVKVDGKLTPSFTIGTCSRL